MKMRNDEFSKTLEQRTRQFALAILKLSVSLSDNQAKEMLRDKLIRSGVAVGANYWKAYRSNDCEEHACMINLCARDARETIQWLEMLEDFRLAEPQTILSLLQDARELLEMFTAMVEEEVSPGKVR